MNDTLTIRIDSDIKTAAKERADQLGLTLSTIIINQLRRFINGAPIVIDDDSLVPSAATAQVRTRALADFRSGDFVVLSGTDDFTQLDALANE